MQTPVEMDVAWLCRCRPSSMAFTGTDTLEHLRLAAERFADDRDWAQFHTPRNLLLAVASEVGEACDLVRWLGDDDPAIPEDIEQDWADELADILILLIRLADRSGVDLNAAFHAKLAKAAEKYPAEQLAWLQPQVQQRPQDATTRARLARVVDVAPPREMK